MEIKAKERTVKMRFYRFRQNNSGGSFKEPGIEVYIEAGSAREANARAEDIGLYFNGCENGQDCSCCGDRWYAVGEGKWDCYETIKIEAPDNTYKEWAKQAGAYIAVFFADGHVETYH